MNKNKKFTIQLTILILTLCVFSSLFFTKIISRNLKTDAIFGFTILDGFSNNTFEITPEKRVYKLAGNDQTTARIRIREVGDSNDIFDQSYDTDSDGITTEIDFEPYNVPIKSYDILAKGLSHLAKEFTSVELGHDTYQIDLSEDGSNPLLAGDINDPPSIPSGRGDNIVNALDLSVLINDLDAFDNRSDLNQDGIVNALDLAAMITNLDVTGDT